MWRSRLLFATPDLLTAAVAGFVVGPMFLLVSGHFSAALGVPLGLIGAGVGCWLAGLPDRPVEMRDGVFTVVALLVAVVWFAYNVQYTAQDVYNTRDPAGYTITGQWLVHHGSLQIDTTPGVFGPPPGGALASGSFALVDIEGILNPQGDHLLPALLGLSGRMFGTTALLSTNVLLAALALIGFFALARRVVGPVFGLMAMLALALSTPFIYVGRDAYTEPLSMLFLMGSLLFALRAWSSRRPQDWAVCGLAAGAATCVRVDGYGALVGIVAAITLYVGVARDNDRRTALRGAGALLLGAAAPVVLGYLDLTHLARQYFQSQHANITHLIGLLVLLVLLSPVCVWLLWHARVRDWLTSERFARRTPQVAALVLTLVFVALATRPAWQQTHGGCHPDLANMQKISNVAVDCTRSYNEQTLRWQALYFGWPTIVLGFVGYGLLIVDLVRRRRYELVAVLAMGLPMSALYLAASEVAPDQPWAMRRYVPVIIPLFLVAAGAALRCAWKWSGRHRIVLRPLVRSLVVVGFLFVVLFPWSVAWPVRHLREERGQLKQLQAICKAVGKDGAIIETDRQTVFGYGQSVRSFCNVPAIGIIDAPRSELAAIAVAVRAHGRVPYVLGQCDPPRSSTGPTCTGPDGTGRTSAVAFSTVVVTRWPTKINSTPEAADIPRYLQHYSVWLARLDESGRPQPVTGGS